MTPGLWHFLGGIMEYIHIVNYEKFQHYNKPNPPWLKFHRTVLEDYYHRSMPDEVKWQLAVLWLLAARHENNIPHDIEYIQNVGGLANPPKLVMLQTNGFIEINDNKVCLEKFYKRSRRSLPQRQRQRQSTETESPPPTPHGGASSGGRTLSKDATLRRLEECKTQK
jgi:hypothetical protein